MTLFWDILRHPSLTSPITSYLARGLVGIAFAIGLFVSLRQRRTRALIALAVVAVTDFIATFVFEVWPNPFLDEVPIHLFLAGFPMLFLTAETILVSKRHVIMCVLMLSSLLGLSIVVNFEYRQYSSPVSLLPDNNVKKMSHHDFLAQKKVPRVERRPINVPVTVSLTGTPSGFQVHDAPAYVPSAYWSQPKRQPPVMVLLAGSPGRPSAWLDSGKANDVADDYQCHHNGRAPLVVSVDTTGSLWGQPGCVDGPKLKIQGYLAKDVPELIKQRFRVNPSQEKWTTGGLSCGGICALQIIANSSFSYGTFLDFSGESHPTVKDLETTVKELFNGDIKASHQVNAADVFRRAAADKSRQYRGVTGKFIRGQHDAPVRQAQNALAPLAWRAGMKVNATTAPGGHNHDVWHKALGQTFDYAAARGGLL